MARRVKTTRLEIIQCATRLFLERGYSSTAPKKIADDMDIGTGNLTYYFPTKEHLLAELVDMLCDFQWKMMEEEADEGFSSIMAICLELTTMASACELDGAVKDFFLSAYTSPMCLGIMRKNDAGRAKEVFRDYCSSWTDEQYAEAELLVSGIEYATLMPAGEPVSLERRISGALDNILRIYNVPANIRAAKIHRVLEMDYRGLSARVLREFKEFVAQTSEQALEELYRARGRRM